MFVKNLCHIRWLTLFFMWVWNLADHIPSFRYIKAICYQSSPVYRIAGYEGTKT
jgi:hypothetical protein